MRRFWTDGRIRNWIVVTLLGGSALLQVGVLGRQSLWADEIFSLATATGHSLEHPAAKADASRGDFVEPKSPMRAGAWRRYLEHENPPAGIARVLRAVFLSDTSPPLYYVMLYEWTRALGANHVTLRLFSVLGAFACLPLMIRIALRVAPPSAAVSSVVLFAFSPPAVYYTGEGRMYSLFWLSVLATAYVTLLLQERRGFRWQVLWVILSAAGLLVHYFFLFPWLAMVAFLLIQPGQDRRGYNVARIIAVGLLILPWYVKLPENLASWRITGDWLNLEPSGYSRFSAARNLVLQFLSGRTLLLWSTPRVVEAFALAAIAVVVGFAVWRMRWRVFAGPRLLLWLWAAAACGAPLVVDAIEHTYLTAISRYAIAALPAVCLLLAGALSAMSDRWRVVLLAAIVGAWSASLIGIHRSRMRSGEPIREMAAFVASKTNDADDLILVHSIPSGVLGFAYYFTGPKTEIASWIGQLGARHMPDSLRELVSGKKRIFFVRFHEVGEPAPEETWLRANAIIQNEKRFATGRVIEFCPKGSPIF